MLSYAQCTDGTGQVDIAIQKQVEEMITHWVNLLQHVVSIITLLSRYGLAFRGDNQTLGFSHNGNYLGPLEFVAKYDAFLAQHKCMLTNAQDVQIIYHLVL